MQPAARASAASTTVAPHASGRSRVLRKIAAYVALTKPRVIELLLVTTAPVMVLAAGECSTCDSSGSLVATLVGGSLSAASANAFNCYIDRDIDAVMKRTQNRPLVTGALSPREALVFALDDRRALDRVCSGSSPPGSRPGCRWSRSCSTCSSTRWC